RGEGLYSTSTLRERLCQAKLRGHLTEGLCQTATIMRYSDEKLRGIRSPGFRRRPPKLRTWVRFPSPAPVTLFPSNHLAIVRGGEGGIKDQNELPGWHRWLVRKVRKAAPHFAKF